MTFPTPDNRHSGQTQPPATFNTLAAAGPAIASLIIAIICVTAMCTGRAAPIEENLASEQDDDPAPYRYEVINATTADPPMTLLFDTAKGSIWEMLEDKDGNMVGFGEVQVESAPTVHSDTPGRFRFVPSGAKQTSHYIVDTAEGRVWVWGGLKSGRSVYVPIGVQGLHE